MIAEIPSVRLIKWRDHVKFKLFAAVLFLGVLLSALVVAQPKQNVSADRHPNLAAAVIASSLGKNCRGAEGE